MVIKTDVRDISLNRAQVARTAPNPPAAGHANGSSRLSERTITNRLSIERSLGDALSIAQMSQSVIQKAISISTRLNSIAAMAMASGSVNSQALTEALHEIRSTMGAYGEQVPNPVQQAAPPARVIEMPDIRGDLSSVRTIAVNIQKGDYAQAERIETVNRNLSGHLLDYRIAETRITGMLRETTPGYAPYAPVRADELMGQITASMNANPARALLAQGNINHAVAEQLMA